MPNTLVDAPLTAGQRTLLSVIADSWLQIGEWPQWYTFHRDFAERGLDAETLLRSLPRVGTNIHQSTSYGFTTALPSTFAETDTIRLTVAAGLVLPDLREALSTPFLRVLRQMVRRQTNPERKTRQDGTPIPPRMDSTLVTRLAGNTFAKALPDLLDHEPVLPTDRNPFSPEGTWQLEISRHVLQYRDTSTLEAYVDTTCQIVTANVALYDEAPAITPKKQRAKAGGRRVSIETFAPTLQRGLQTTTHWQTPGSTPALSSARAPYLDDDLFTAIKDAAQTTTWKVDKLLALCTELNDSYASGNAYACAALLRAVLDHIPPVFGHKDFKQVAAQHTFTVQRTDKAHAQKLASFKDIADDALHRPISANIPLITMNDIPEPTRLRAVLHELVTVLNKDGTTITI
ncbi:hypothetical protein [Streptomyces sp. NPDC058084]|uniref:hypothetical protein n=1 Tax=Streptomyces sp. NPDC058084 TaxID=3346333 RepID=UPI0036EA541D